MEKRNCKKIFILGAGIMQIPAIKIAKRKGWTVIVADCNQDAPGSEFADYFEHIDLKDKKKISAAAGKYKNEIGLDGVFTAGTDFSTTVAWVAQEYNLPGIPYNVALSASDKAIMRETFKSKGIPSPDYIVLNKDDNPEKAVKRLSYPVVVKPVDNMGARGIRKVDSNEALKESVALAFENSRTSRIIIEEYIDGPEYSIDAIIDNREVTICGFADRHIFFPPYFIEMGHTIPSLDSTDVVNKVAGVFIDGVKALGITTGAAKGDLKLSKKGVIIGEIAARLSGGYMSGWTYPLSSGVEVTEAALNLAVGLPKGPLSQKWKKISAERACISIPGKVKEIKGIKAAQKLKWVKDVFIRVAENDEVFFPTNNVQKCGNIITCAEIRGDAVSAAENGCRMIQIRLEPMNKDTESFLFKNKNPWIPDAYCLLRDENKCELAVMPFTASFLKGRLDNPTISILPLPAIEEEKSFDWHGRRMSDAFSLIIEETACKEGENGDIVLGSIFWKAFIRGGIQGALWLIDTVRLMAKEGRTEELVGLCVKQDIC